MLKQYRLISKSDNIQIVYSITEARALVVQGWKLLSSGVKQVSR